MYGKPAILTSAEELAKAFPDKEWQARIGAQVNFARERLFYFAWTGAPGETLGFTIEDRLLHTEEGKTGPIVVFHHWAGRTSEIHITQTYIYLFAVAKNATSQTEEDKKAPPVEPTDTAFAACGVAE